MSFHKYVSPLPHKPETCDIDSLANNKISLCSFNFVIVTFVSASLITETILRANNGLDFVGFGTRIVNEKLLAGFREAFCFIYVAVRDDCPR